MELNKRYMKDENMVSRQIGSEMILVPVHRNVGDLDNVYSLNETAAFIWSQIDGERTLEQIRDSLLEEFETHPAQAEQDLLKYTRQLLEIRGIREVNGNQKS